METPLNIITPENGIVEIRTGEALELKQPLKVEVSGNITAVSSFLEKRYVNGTSQEGNSFQYIVNTKVIVIADKTACTIELHLDPEEHYGTIIKGQLAFDKDFQNFDFNKGQVLSKDDVLQKFKFAQRFFSDPLTFQKFINSFQRLELVISNEIKAIKEQGGSSNQTHIREVTSKNIPTYISLSVPIFKGFPKKTFNVDIWIHATDGGAKFEFVSQELSEMVENEKEVIFNDALQSCSDFVIIHK